MIIKAPDIAPRSFYLPFSRRCEAACSGLRGIGCCSKDFVDLGDFSSFLSVIQKNYHYVCFPCYFLWNVQRDLLQKTLQKSSLPFVIQIVPNIVGRDYRKLCCEILQTNQNCRANILLGVEEEWPKEFIEELTSKKIEYSLTFLAKPGKDYFKTLNEVPESLRQKLCFHFPAKTAVPLGMTCPQIYRETRRIKRDFPGIQINPSPWVRIASDIEDITSEHFKYQLLLENQNKNADIKISIIIPTRNNRPYVLNSINHLLSQTLDAKYFEIIIVDDNSTDGSLECIKGLFKKNENRNNWKYLLYFRSEKNKIFRAATARNIGASEAGGKVISFLDADLIVPPNYLEYLLQRTNEHEVLLAKRFDLSEKISRKKPQYDEIKPKDLVIREGGYWERFFFKGPSWDKLKYPWKYLCSYALTLNKETFARSGWFTDEFTSYGYEDIDLGYRLVRLGYKLTLLDLNLYHQGKFKKQGMFSQSSVKKRFLLRRSAALFYRRSLTTESYYSCRYLFKRALLIRLLFYDFISYFIPKKKDFPKP